MLLTLYYMYATFIQWWKISSMRNKISKAMTNKTALVLYQKDRQCENSWANLKDLLFCSDQKIGCTMVPKQRILLNTWMPFSRSTLFPFLSNNLKLASPSFPILIHADLNSFCCDKFDQIQITDLGIPVAWTVEDDFSIVLKTDLNNFAKLVSCFLTNFVAINDGMEVLRIETIDLDGEPKVVENESVFKNIKWPFPVSSQNQWNQFVIDLKMISKKICTPNKNGNCPNQIVANSEILSTIPIIICEPICTTKLEQKKSNDLLKVEKKQKTKSSDKPTSSSDKPNAKPDKISSDKAKGKRSHSKDKLAHSDSSDRLKSRENGDSDKPDKRSRSKDKQSGSADHLKHIAENDIADKRERRSHKVKQSGSSDHLRHLDETSSKLSSDKSKRSSSKDKLKHSSSSDRLKQKEEKIKKDLTHKSKKFVKKHSKEKLIDEIVPEEKDLEVHNKMADLGAPKKVFIKAKPPNVLVYADSSETRENVKTVLHDVLNNNRYTIYELSATTSANFTDNCTLVVVCGNVNPQLTSQLLHYLLNGGHLLCLCSDFLNSVLHTFTTAEVREHELVRFSYGEWKRVRMMHHIFCYQASPAKKHFSQDSDPNSSNHSSGNSPVAPRTPSTVELTHNNRNHTVHVRVLGQEETWQTPSILLASVKNNNGKAVFSQVHLEIDPDQYQSDENKYAALKESNSSRLEILKDILSSHLNMDCVQAQRTADEYTPAYFLGKHDSKLKLLAEIGLIENRLKLSKLTLTFCGKDVKPPVASSTLLPILIHSCPDHFSTIEYFENLQTTLFGRLVIYSDVMTSSMDVLDTMKYDHGLVVLPARQTAGTGRGGNAWLSPVGCAMFSMQLHIPMNSVLGNKLPLIQHLVSVAIVAAIRCQDGYEEIDLGLKWPNDIYADSSIKIGGIILNSSVESTVAICNIGSGTNLSNSLPTTCINSLITKYNETKGTTLKTLSYEKYLALVFTELERLYDLIQSGRIDEFYDLYYKYWLHTGADITVQTADGTSRDVTITGIDQFGYLAVTSHDGVTSSVEPDGNTFDMMQGLIAPKIR